ncbi:MAG: asparagine synthase (glutamine-hydrolyzing) [Gammaproteobacteria bacterium]
MCGIAGFSWEDPEKIRTITELLDHRGPDQTGFHIKDGVSLGHKRLSILDLSPRGKQPMFNEDGSICVVYNGEIYNFKDLRDELIKTGHQFKSDSDTEVLVHGYEEWGTDLPTRLNGQFAFCILDSNKQKLFLARDRFGIKPLYYYYQGDQFIFGSEMKVLLKAGIPKELAPDNMQSYWALGFRTGSETLLKNVFHLAPAHCISYDLRQKRIEHIKPFWSLQFSQDYLTDKNEIMELLAEKLEASVKRRLLSDVPVGAFLSGGIDSSIIVALMRKHVSALKTFSIRFDHAEFNESSYAQTVSNQFETDHYEIEFDASNIRELIPKLPFHFDEPFADPSMIPTYLVSKVAREQVTVCLSGTGADELFSGYDRYKEFFILQRLNRLPSAVKYLLDHGIDAANLFAKNDKLSKLQTFLQGPLSDSALYTMLFSYMYRNKNEKLDMANELDRYQTHFKYKNTLENLLNQDLNVYIPDCLLVKEDRASLGVSLEARVPFLDHEFAEFTTRIPPSLKAHRGDNKYILKQTFKDILPPVVFNRSKMGFGVPLVHYFRNELKTYAEEIIFDTQYQDHFDHKLVRDLWNRHQSKHSDYSRIFWSIMMYKLWHKEWLS